jgi:hypothetical protein
MKILTRRTVDHAAEADCGNLGTMLPALTVLHVMSSTMSRSGSAYPLAAASAQS